MDSDIEGNYILVVKLQFFYNPQQPYHHKSLWAQNVYMLPSQESDHNWEVDWSHISECVLVMVVVGWLLPNWS